MASYLRPRRGKKATAESQNIVLKRGEVFFEVPDTGVGTGAGKVKMGDGSTGYADLPYMLTETNVGDSLVAFTDSSTPTAQTNNQTYLNNIKPASNVKTIFTNLKQLLLNFNDEIEKGTGTDLTQAEYDVLPAATKAAGTFYITDAGSTSLIVDSQMSTTSTNAVQNRVITANIGSEITQAEYNQLTPAQKQATFYITDAPSAQVNIDTTLSATSSNPVQNKVVTNAINEINSDLTELEYHPGDTLSTYVSEIGFTMSDNRVSFEIIIPKRIGSDVTGITLDSARIMLTKGTTVLDMGSSIKVSCVAGEGKIYSNTLASSYTPSSQPQIYGVSGTVTVTFV